MKTYNSLPKKYAGIEPGTIKIIDGYAYAVQKAKYSGERDTVYRVTESEYNKFREDAQTWEVYQSDPTEENLQLQIWCYMTDIAGIEPFCRTTPY